MAFNEPLQPVVQSGIQANSRGFTPNTAYGEIFSGLGDAIKNGLTAYDETKKVEIEKAAYADVEAVIKETMPPDITAGVTEDIENIQMAAEQGSYSDVAMRTKMDQAAKRRIAQNPAYAPLIQRQFAAALGTNSANDLRTARLQAIESASVGGKEKYNQKVSYYNSNADVMGTAEFRSQYLQETGTAFVEGSMEYDEIATRKIVSRQRAITFKREEAKAEAEADEKFAPKYARGKAAEIKNNVFSMVQDSPLGDLMKKVDVAKADGIQGPEKEALVQNWGMLKTAYLDQVRTALSDTTDAGMANLSSADREAIMKSAEAEVEVYEKMLLDDEYGLLKSATRELANHKEDHQHKLMKDNSMILNYSYLKGMVPDEVALSIWNSTEQKFAAQTLQEEVAKMLTVKIPQGTAKLSDIVEIESELGDSKAKPGVMLDFVTGNLEKMLTHPDLTDEQLAANIRGIFTKENIDFLNTKVKPESRLSIFNRLIKPGVVERLKASGDQVSLKALETWGTGQFMAITGPHRASLEDAAVHTDNIKVTYKDGRFAVDGSGVSKVIGAAPISGAMDIAKGNAAIKAAADINLYIDRMTPVWEANGFTRDQVVQSLMGEGFGGESNRQGSFMTKMYNAVGEFLSPAKAEASTPKESTKATVGGDEGKLLGFISKAEGADYKTMFGGSKVDLEGMTVAEVQAYQKKHGSATGSSATGAYQVMRQTLKDLIMAGVVDEDEMFTPELQDRIALSLLNRRGYQKWKAGKISDEAFADNLAKEWASLPTAAGKSFYDGDSMGNKATRKRDQMMALLKDLKQ